MEYVNQNIVEPYLDDPQGPVFLLSPLYMAGLDNAIIEFLGAEEEVMAKTRKVKTENLLRLDRAKAIAKEYSK